MRIYFLLCTMGFWMFVGSALSRRYLSDESTVLRDGILKGYRFIRQEALR